MKNILTGCLMIISLITRAQSITIAPEKSEFLQNDSTSTTPLLFRSVKNHVATFESTKNQTSSILFNDAGGSEGSLFWGYGAMGLSSRNIDFVTSFGDVRINETGFLGIRETDPSAPLHIKGYTTDRLGHIVLERSNAGDFSTIYSNQNGLNFENSNGFHSFWFRSSTGTQLARISSSGDLTISGDFFQNSDLRLKTNIAKVQHSSHKLAQLQAYNYNWKATDSDPSLQTGLVAQEVQKQFPELVNESENGYLSVNYIGLIPHLIEAHKELKAENEELKERLQKIEEKLNLETQTTSTK